MAIAPCAAADGLLDWVRRYDLNDYALGISVWTGENPYADSQSSTVLYPYLTSFLPSALSDDWLTLRGSELDVRYVAGDWEFGLTGRVQTLGFGPDSRLALEGLDHRGWTVEAGPMIGWRGWPVHAQLRSYIEAPNRHGGSISELEFLWPVSLSRGYFIPSIGFSYLSGSYADYYFGIAPAEATPTLPAYEVGAAMNASASVMLGYQVAPKWLLQVSLGLEWLDDAVSRSPIVTKDRVWSGSVGLAYNADLFEPRESAGERRSSLELRLSLLDGSIDSEASRRSATTAAGDALAVEELPGASDRRSALKLDALLRAGFYHRFEFSWVELDWGGTGVLARDVSFGEETFPPGTLLQSSLYWQSASVGYGYSVIRDGQKELGVSAGISYARIELDLVAPDLDRAESFQVETPLPTIGVYGAVPLRGQWTVGAEIRLFAVDFDEYSGYSGFAGLTVERRFGESLGIGVGYDLYALSLDAGDDALDGSLEFRNQGPRLFLAWSF